MGVETLVAAHLKRDQCHARRQRQLAPVKDVQAVQVLRGDRLVGADVEDVDPLARVPELLDRPRDHAARLSRIEMPQMARRGAGERHYQTAYVGYSFCH